MRRGKVTALIFDPRMKRPNMHHGDGAQQRRSWSGNRNREPPLRYVWSVASTTRHTAHILFRNSGQESVVERSMGPR